MSTPFFDSTTHQLKRIIGSTIVSILSVSAGIRFLVSTISSVSTLYAIGFGVLSILGTITVFITTYILCKYPFEILRVVRSAFGMYRLGSAKALLTAEWISIKESVLQKNVYTSHILGSSIDSENERVNIEILANHKYGVLKLDFERLGINFEESDWRDSFMSGDKPFTKYESSYCHFCNSYGEHVAVPVYSYPDETSAGFNRICKSCLKEAVEHMRETDELELETEVVATKI